MQKQLIKHCLLAGIAVFATAAIALPTFAQEKQQTTTTTTQEKIESTSHQRTAAQEKLTQARTDAKTKLAEQKEAVKTKLTEHKLKACQKREKNINNIMARQADRGTKHLAVFTKIADRTMAFYAEKGKVLSNYDALVAEVASKKAAAEVAIESSTSSSVTFKCDGTDPKGAASLFKDSHKEQNEALKAYKTAVKNLIVGVKSVQSTTVKNTEGAQ
jgi:hypothetical protein